MKTKLKGKAKSSTERARLLYRKRREAGLCVRCGEPAARSRTGKVLTRCAKHLEEG